MRRVWGSTLLFMLALLASTGCHHIKSDYPVYLEKHRASPEFSRVLIDVRYSISEATLRHRSVIRAATAGYGNKWIVDFGAMLEQTLESTEVRQAFASLGKRSPESGKAGFELAFELVDYRVSGFAAHVLLRIRLLRDGAVLIDKVYARDGATQAGKVVWGGAFSMRSALQATTKHALDVILRELLIDVQRVLSPGVAAERARVQTRSRRALTHGLVGPHAAHRGREPLQARAATRSPPRSFHAS